MGNYRHNVYKQIFTTDDMALWMFVILWLEKWFIHSVDARDLVITEKLATSSWQVFLYELTIPWESIYIPIKSRNNK